MEERTIKIKVISLRLKDTFHLLWFLVLTSLISNLILRMTSPWLKCSCVCLLRGPLQMTPCVRFLQEPGFHRPLLLWIQKQEFGDRTEKATSCASQLVYDISVSSLHTRPLPAAGTNAHTLRRASNTLRIVSLVLSYGELICNIMFWLTYLCSVIEVFNIWFSSSR